MKTKLHFAFALSLKLFFTVNFLSFSQTYIVNDDFESDALGTFPNSYVIRYNGTGNSDQKIVDSPVKNGIHSFQLSGSGWAANISKSVSEIPIETTLEGWVRAENVASGGRCGLGIGNPSIGSWGAYLARVEFYNGNLITFNYTGNSGGYGTQYVLQAATPNTWYHIKIEINTDTSTYKVYINSELASSDTSGSTITEFPLLTTVSPTSIELYGNSMVYFDDIKLYESLNLIAHYPFNGNANDESGNNLHGTVSGATLAMDRFDNPDSAYSFDGNDIITIAHDDLLNSSDELTLSVWVKPNSQQNAMILGKSNYTTNTNYLLRTKSSGYIAFEYKDFANSNSLPLIVNDWNHIAAVSQTDNTKLVYINGVLATHTSASSPFGIVTNPLTIGAASYNSEYFNGSIDDLRIYKSSLSETDILALYNNNALGISNTQIDTNRSFHIFNNNLYFKNDTNISDVKSVLVYNLLAQKVFKTHQIEQKTSLQFLQNGIYLIKVEFTDGQNIKKKVLIQ